MLPQAPLLETIATGLVLAFAFGAAAARVRLSPLVGYLAAGVVAGPFTPGLLVDQALAHELSELGVILLMFGVGLHFSLGDLLEVRTIAVPGAVVQIALATALGAGLTALLGWPLSAGLMFGLALSCASTVVLLRALEERRLLDTARGKIAVGWLIVEDLVTVLALVLVPALAGVGAPDGAGLGLALALTLLKIAGFLALMLIVGRPAIPWLLERVAGTGSRELFTLCVLALALGVALGAAVLFNVSFALGAFFAGMLLADSEFSHKAAHDSLPLRDAFAVLFFVSVGMLFDPRILVEQPLRALATCGIILFGKSLAALAIVLAFRHPLATALTIAVSLAQIGEFSFILAGLGVDLGLLPTSGRDLILAGAILSILLNPVLFAAVERWQVRHEDVAERHPAPHLPSGPPAPEGPYVLLIGFGRVGSAIAQILRERGVPLLVVDTDPDLVERAHSLGIPAIRGNAANPRVLAEAAPSRVRLALLAIPRPLEAGEIVARLRDAKPDMTIIARGHSDAAVQHLLHHGADGAVMAERVMALRMAEMATQSLRYHERQAAGPEPPSAA